MVPSGNSPVVEVRLDDAGRGDELRIAGNGPGQPVDVRRLEGRHLSERVTVELAKGELHPESVRQWRRNGPAEIADSCSLEGTGRVARPRGLAVLGVEPEWRLAGRMRRTPVT
jgi:hypothetical protein